MSLEIGCGEWTLTILPELGGALGALRYRGIDVMRPTPEEAGDPLATACFPLVPYANRIANGRFTFEGQDHRLPRNRTDQAHPLHGVGWQKPWRVEDAAAGAATLSYAHASDEHWPWDWHAEQHVALDESGLRMTLSLTNQSVTTMPCSLGFHPYFPVNAATTLRFEADAVWTTDDALLPVDRAPVDRFGEWARGQAVQRATLVDNSYEGWRAAARIGGTAAGTLELSGENTRFLHLYVPPGESFFCVEPTSAMPDAFNHPGAGTVLPPSESRRIGMALRRQ